MQDNIILELGDWQLSLQALLLYFAFIVVYYLVYVLITKQLWRGIKNNGNVNEASLSVLKKIFIWFAILVFILISIWVLRLDFVLARGENFDISIGLIVKALLVFQAARLIDWMLVNVIIENYYSKREETSTSKTSIENSSSAAQIVKYILYAIVAVVLIKQFGLDYPLYHVNLDNGDSIGFSITDVISAVLVILFARLALWVITQIFLYGLYNRNKIEIGAQYAINQLLKYVVYIIAFFIALDRLGINMTLVWGGAAALLVGVGLGLQQTFNDFFSGIVLLFERSVSIGDSVQINNEVATVKKIGLRSSELQTRENMTLIVPNSQLVNEKVINWNHYDAKTRFTVMVGAAYGSDTALVRKILLDVAKDNSNVVDYPSPVVRLIDFGESSLDFQLIFFSRNFMIIEDIKSDLRFEIDKRFNENGISIPFPQRTVHINNINP